MGRSRVGWLGAVLLGAVLVAPVPASGAAAPKVIWERPFAGSTQGERIEKVGRDGGDLVFWTTGETSRRPVYRTDGTREGTVDTELQHEWVGNGNGLGDLGRLSIFVRYGDEGPEPWVSDGTRDGTRILKDVYPGTRGSYPSDPVVFRGRLYFAATDPEHGNEIWVTDGTPEGTRLFADLDPGPDGETRPVAAGARTLFLTSTASVAGEDLGSELWASDGTLGGTRFVADVDPGGSSPGIDGDEALVVDDGGTDRLWTTAHTESDGRELWTSDGTSDGTRQVDDLRVGAQSSNPRNLLAWRGSVYFVAETVRSHDHSLFRSVGNAAVEQLSDLGDVVTGDVPTSFRPLVVGGTERLLFTSPDGLGGHPLWQSDGTVAGTGKIGLPFPAQSRVLIVGAWRGQAVLGVRPSTGPDRGWAAPWICDLTSTGTRPLSTGSLGEQWKDAYLLGDRLVGVRETPGSGDQLVALSLPEATRGSTTTVLRAGGSTYGGVIVRATPRTSAGIAASGLVTFRADGRPIGTARLVGGTATLRLPASVLPGTRTIAATYAGDDAWRPSTISARVSIVRASARLDARGRATWKRGQRPKVRIRLDAPGLPTRGTWQVRSRGRLLASGSATSRSRTEVRLPRLRAGRHRIVVRWSGSATTLADRERHVVRVGRR